MGMSFDIRPAFLRPERDPATSLEDGFSPTTAEPNHSTPNQPATAAHNEKLLTFRHMVGIHSMPTRRIKAHVSGPSLQFPGRTAPNKGIYNRVVFQEKSAKYKYRVASALISSCLGAQVIFGAALTAMGASGGNYIGITAVGAINTMLAGTLTYLKGSGLPNRIHYYEMEWKRVREFIEQRERDFSNHDCRLNVYETVRRIETMYEEVKINIQTNTPDNYISVGDERKRIEAADAQVTSFLNGQTGNGGHISKLKELELTYGHRIAGFLEDLAHKEEERLRRLADQHGKVVERKASQIAEEVNDINKEVLSTVEKEIEIHSDAPHPRSDP